MHHMIHMIHLFHPTRLHTGCRRKGHSPESKPKKMPPKAAKAQAMYALGVTGASTRSTVDMVAACCALLGWAESYEDEEE